MTFDEWWDSDKRFVLAHADERTQAQATWQSATLAEREECAKVCEGLEDAEYATGKVDHNERSWCGTLAAAIRNRSKSDDHYIPL